MPFDGKGLPKPIEQQYSNVYSQWGKYDEIDVATKIFFLQDIGIDYGNPLPPL